MSKNNSELFDKYKKVREKSIQLTENLSKEEMTVQPSAEVSPIKWHLGHTSWFFDKLILNKQFGIQLKHSELMHHVFNSYYKALGKTILQSARGTLSKPTVDEILDYRHEVDFHILNLNDIDISNLHQMIVAGIHHEQQHQELMLMDIKYIKHMEYEKTPFSPVLIPQAAPVAEAWYEINEGLYTIGSQIKDFHYDNESPCHKVYVHKCALRANYVTNGEFLEFIQSGGYQNPLLWLSLGWEWVQKNNILNPLYWIRNGQTWEEFTLSGVTPLDFNAPVCHISYFEAEAFARWKNLRLPTEAEFEIYLSNTENKNKITRCSSVLHPLNDTSYKNELWCWTSSHYSPYPGFKTFSGDMQEYNGKFMCNQFVLRGGCFATPPGHYRNTYRNFYQPEQRWMFSGIRLARDV